MNTAYEIFYKSGPLVFDLEANWLQHNTKSKNIGEFVGILLCCIILPPVVGLCVSLNSEKSDNMKYTSVE